MNTVSEGTLSASRILRTAPVECGFGHCAATVDCTGACKIKEAIIGLPVIDARFLDEQIKRSKDLPIDFVLPDDEIKAFVEDVEGIKKVALRVAIAVFVICMAVALW